jgi:hypothetical protein
VALKFNKQSLEDFHERLSSVDASWQEDFTLKEIVRKSLKPISKARRYKVSWEKIALMLQEATGGELEISATSVRQYYFELMEKTPKEAVKSNKTKSERKRKKPQNIQTKDSEILETVLDKEVEIFPENPSSISEESPAKPFLDARASSEETPPEPLQDFPGNPPAIPPKTSEKSRRKPQSEIQSSFNLRRR